MKKQVKQILEPDWLAALNSRADIGPIPLDDEKTLDLFKKGKTEGVFGFGSPDMQKILKRLKPDCFDDLMVLCALYRPETPSRPEIFELLPEYIAKKRGKQEVDYIHMDLEEILSPTCGMLVYQEQVTEILCKMAGYTPEGAEAVRRIFGKRNPSKVVMLEPEFFCKCTERGYPKYVVRKVWDLLLPNAGQAALKTYVSVFTFAAYRSAFLKAHFKVDFVNP
jgi:DNA polymerase-3 subunit alpha